MNTSKALKSSLKRTDQNIQAIRDLQAMQSRQASRNATPPSNTQAQSLRRALTKLDTALDQLMRCLLLQQQKPSPELGNSTPSLSADGLSTPTKPASRSGFPVPQVFGPQFTNEQTHQITTITATLDQTVGKGNWAFTGSFALFIQAKDKGIASRTPNDLDIIVSPKHFESATETLRASGFFGSFCPAVDQSTKDYLRIPAASDSFFSLDLLKTSDQFGRLRATKLHKVPVLDLQTLYERKNDTLTSSSTKDQDLAVMQAILREG